MMLCLYPCAAARERIRRLREDLANRRRMLAEANSITANSTPNPSPPHQTLPGSFPGQPFSSPPPTTRPILGHRRPSNSSSSNTPSPSRPPSSVSRNSQAFPGTPQAPRVSAVHPKFGTPSTPSSHSPSSLQRPTPTAAATNDLNDQETARQIEEANWALTTLSDTIARARSGLVQELVEVFSVVEVGGRPPIGGKAGTKGEWTIGGLVLPVPGDMRRTCSSLSRP